MNKRVLIVEDSKSIQKLYTLGFEMLREKYDIKIDTESDIMRCASYTEFVNMKGLETDFDVAVIDWILENNEFGHQVIEDLLKKSNPPKIFIVSGMVNMKDDMEKYAKQYDIPLIMKPFELDDFEMIIKKIVKQCSK